MGKIRALDPSVVNKIAAGEIIISPVNALKEILENSIDAGATMLEILVRDGGIKLLQVSDNGCGIQLDDFPLLCERFATSKLTNFQDLENIATYGFRGEALASISHIARLSVTTKTNDEQCAYKVSYNEGKMVDKPKPVAGKNGTSIHVEDLFYNIPSRLRALKTPNEEFTRILDVVGRYGIHSKGIGFSCKKFGDSSYSITLKPDFTTIDRIRSIYGNNVATSIIGFEMDSNENLGLTKVSGYISTSNLNNKKSVQPIFFINDRLVTCDPLRRAIYNTYTNYLPKGTRPFIYLSINISPPSVDVNVHPTKREVRFLHQDEIIDEITTSINDQLSKLDTTRTFNRGVMMSKPLSDNSSTKYSQTATPATTHPMNSSQTSQRRYENKLVRVDSSQAKITSFLKSSQYNPAEYISASQHIDKKSNTASDNNKDKAIPIDLNDDVNITRSQSLRDESQSNTYSMLSKERVTVNLTSIESLRNQVDMSAHKELTEIFAGSNYIGIVDYYKRLLTIQFDLKLFLVDYGAICNELFYQIGLTDFANFGTVQLQTQDTEQLSIRNILKTLNLAETKIDEISSQLVEMKEMLWEYFSIEIIENESHVAFLKTIPLLLKGYTPPLSKLPLFIYRLGTIVNWNSEQECLDGILKQIALFYIPEIIMEVSSSSESPKGEKHSNTENAHKKEELSEKIEHVIYPCLKRRFLAPSSIVDDVIEIANLPGLYKVFERC